MATSWHRSTGRNPASHWLVYSNNPNTSTFGNLNSNNTAVWNATYATLPPLAVTVALAPPEYEPSPVTVPPAPGVAAVLTV